MSFNSLSSSVNSISNCSVSSTSDFPNRGWSSCNTYLTGSSSSRTSSRGNHKSSSDNWKKYSPSHPGSTAHMNRVAGSINRRTMGLGF